METTLDVAGLPEDRIQYLKNLVVIWKARGEHSGGLQPIIKRKVAPSEFIVKDSDVVDGEVTRAMAYDE